MWPFHNKALVPPELPLEAPLWAAAWSEESLDLAYSAAEGVRDLQAAWVDSLDTKVVGVFGVASALLAIVPTLKTPDTTGGRILWAVAVFTWLGTCGFCYKAYRPAAFRVGPNPSTMLGEDWLGRTPTDFRLWRLASMGRSYEHNSAVLSTKGKALTAALALTAAEVLALTAGLFLGGPR